MLSRMAPLFSAKYRISYPHTQGAHGFFQCSAGTRLYGFCRLCTTPTICLDFLRLILPWRGTLCEHPPEPYFRP